MTSERNSRQLLEFVSIYKVVLQGLADGIYDKSQITRLESRIKFPIIVRALIGAVKHHQISTENIQREQNIPLNEPDLEFIRLKFEGNVDSQICQFAEWDMEKLKKHRNRVLRSLGINSDYQMVAWEARRRLLLGEL